MAPRDDAFIAQAGVDPLFSRYPMRSHRSDVTIRGKPASILRMLREALASLDGAVALNRRDQLRTTADGARATTRDEDLSPPITKAFMSEVLGRVLDADTAVFNEYWGMPNQLKRTKPGTYFFLPPAGGLGWALPAALGASHVSSKPTVALMGDGAYLFANPAACHHAAARNDLPVLTIIANNAAWGAVERATQGVYPDGEAITGGDRRFSDLGPNPAFETYCIASGGYGERVTERAELAPAILRALHAVQHEGRQALLNVECAD